MSGNTCLYVDSTRPVVLLCLKRFGFLTIITMSKQSYSDLQLGNGLQNNEFHLSNVLILVQQLPSHCTMEDNSLVSSNS